MKKPIDLFSKQARWYQQYRPVYPKALYEFILSHCAGRGLAWDCATGNGQVAIVLSDSFEEVIATDISEAQLAQARRKRNIQYRIAPAEESGIGPNSVDLITVGQALHWFDHKAFNKEVSRVLKPGGILAVWGYGSPVIEAAIDQHLAVFYNETVGPYWHPARRHIESAYRKIPLNLKEIPVKGRFEIVTSWKLHQFEGYLRSWSSVQKYLEHEEDDPVQDFIALIRKSWGGNPVKVVFPLFLRIGKKLD